ncbi:MAG TPA: hypothetical protein VK498_14185 [Ferruginibacter sp.]|nr:hypothetical protein [Ferruginibacter sp.]
MKRIPWLLFGFFIHAVGYSQNIVYSKVEREDNRDIIFEILGKVGPHFIVYKNVRWRHFFQVFDKDMNTLSNDKMSFIPEKTINVDFVTYPDFFYMIYQYEKGNTIYCKAVKFDQDAKKMGEPVLLDTTRVILGNNKIYTTVFSEDKKRILVFKAIEKNDLIIFASKLYDNNMTRLDSTRFVTQYNYRKEIYSEFNVANDGSIIVAKEIRAGLRENINEVDLMIFKPGEKDWSSYRLPIDNKYIDEVKIRVDNLNNNYIVNSFYYTQRRGSIEGLFAAVFNKTTSAFRVNFNRLNDSLRSKITSEGQFRGAFDNLFIRNIFLKRDGGYLLIAEDFSSQTRSSNPWNRWDYIYSNNYDYYGNSSYYPYYRPWNRYNNVSTTRYFYDNMLVAGLDSSLKLQWNNIIFKSQSDDDNDNFLSYTTLNDGAEIHFLFIEREKNSQIIANHSITPFGNYTRYPTLKSREAGYLFMPRLSKQTNMRQMIIPCMYRGYICFAKVDF